MPALCSRRHQAELQAGAWRDEPDKLLGKPDIPLLESDEWLMLCRPYKDTFWKNIMAKMFAAEGVKQTAEEVAEVMKQAIEDAKPHLRYQTSDFVHQQAKKKLVDPSGDSLLKEQMEYFQ